MKKLILTALVISGLTGVAFAQGTVQWSGVANQFFAQTNAIAMGGTQGFTTGNTAVNNAALGYQGYYYELLIGSGTAPTTVAGLSGWTDTGLIATNGTAANGRIIQAADDGVPANTQATATGWIAGSTTNVILVGWSANLGSTWSAVLTALQTQGYAALPSLAYFGVSALGTLASGTGNPGVIVFGSGAGQINNIASPMQLLVLPTPEPGTLALAAIGGASLLLFRRRK